MMYRVVWGGGGVLRMFIVRMLRAFETKKACIKIPRTYFCFEVPHETRQNTMTENLGGWV